MRTRNFWIMSSSKIYGGGANFFRNICRINNVMNVQLIETELSAGRWERRTLQFFLLSVTAPRTAFFLGDSGPNILLLSIFFLRYAAPGWRVRTRRKKPSHISRDLVHSITRWLFAVPMSLLMHRSLGNLRQERPFISSHAINSNSLSILEFIPPARRSKKFPSTLLHCGQCQFTFTTYYK